MATIDTQTLYRVIDSMIHVSHNRREITSIQVTQDLRKRLSKLGNIGDSYQQVIEMLLEEYETKAKKELT